MPPRKEIAKVSLGAEDMVPWETGMIADVINLLRAHGYRVYGLETGDDAQPITAAIGDKLALVLGNEVNGIDKDTLSQLDGKLVIAMDKKRSLNVSVASGVAMYVLSARS